MAINSISLYLLTQINSHVYELNNDASPVLDNKMNFAMTPIFDKNKPDPFKEGSFEQLQSFSLDCHISAKNKKTKKSRPRIHSSWYIVQNQLEGIIEQNDSQPIDQAYSESEEQAYEQSSQNQDDNEQNSQQQAAQGEGEKLSNSFFENSNYQFKCPEWQAANPKKQLISKLKGIASNQQLKTEEGKIICIVETFNKYLCEYERYYFQQLISNLRKESSSALDLIAILIKGVEQTFKRQIRGLSFEKRRLKLLRYLDKKKRRVWRKKVSYDCRKKVADGRLRIKGKFVTHEQACEQLGLTSVEGYTPEQIKEMLYRKMEQS